ncbi:MAG: DUF1186 domain-containing protein [Acidobacteriota bacterium]
MSENIKETIGKIAYFDGTFPKEDLQKILDNRAEFTPFLLDALRNTDELLTELLSGKDYFLPFYAPLILAQFREEKAYPLVYEIFSADAKMVDDAYGDFITEDLHRVLASVSGGDVSLINKLIEDENVYEFVRSAGLDAWLCLFRAGLKTREEVVSYFKTLFEMPCGEEDLLRGALVSSCLDLKAVELLPEIEKSYAENKVELMLMGDWDDFQEMMAEEKSSFLDDSGKYHDLIDDMISDVEKWICFTNPEEYMRDFETPEFETKDNLMWDSQYEGTFVRDTPKVGKNEPCPCNSGRKYKKCCMN